MYLVQVHDLPLAVLGLGPRRFSQNVTNNILHYVDECLSLLLHQVLVKERLRLSDCNAGKPNPQKLRFRLLHVSLLPHSRTMYSTEGNISCG